MATDMSTEAVERRNRRRLWLAIGVLGAFVMLSGIAVVYWGTQNYTLVSVERLQEVEKIELARAAEQSIYIHLPKTGTVLTATEDVAGALLTIESGRMRKGSTTRINGQVLVDQDDPANTYVLVVDGEKRAFILKREDLSKFEGMPK